MGLLEAKEFLTPSAFLTRVKETQVLVALHAHKESTGKRNRVASTQTGVVIWDASIINSGFSLCATMSMPYLTFKNNNSGPGGVA